jgi:hypothetical protein
MEALVLTRYSRGLAQTSFRFLLDLSQRIFKRLDTSGAEMDIRIKRTGFVLVGLLLFCPTALHARGVFVTVTNTNDSGPGSLRQALADVHDGDFINFARALNGQTITLTGGELLVDKSITISSPGPTNLTVNADGMSRVLHTGPGTTVSISGLTITGGVLLFPNGGNGGGVLNDHATLRMTNCTVDFNAADIGGGIYNDGSSGNATLAVINSSVNGNFAPTGAGIVNDGEEGSATLTIVNSTVNDNRSTNGSPPADFGVAGGIANSFGIVTITNSTISGNLASNEAGGILNGGTLAIFNSTISGNGAGGFGTNNWPGRGGGVSSEGTLTISNSTISGNSAWGNDFKGPGYGGGISGVGVEINNSTISGNSATVGGGIFAGGNVAIGNTILNNNSGANIDGTVTSHGYNVSSDDGGGNLNGPGDQINTDPLLVPLQDNGGPTFTHALLPGSPAIDAGDPIVTGPSFSDQRGARFRRVFNGRIDIGSFETQPQPPPLPTPRPRATPCPCPTMAPR